MSVISLLVLLALICFVFGAFPPAAVAARINLVSLGLAFAAAAALVGTGGLH
jgi:hypothetical protein